MELVHIDEFFIPAKRSSLSKDQVQLQTNYQDSDVMGFRWFQ